jgi:HEAT repeat protein
MPVLPSNDELQEVKVYGDRAVTVLATYVDSSEGLEQHLAIRFLLEFHNDPALAALRAFAERSKISGIREEAVAALTGFPTEKVKGIVEHISKSDPDPEVRSYARRILATFPVREGPQK